MKKILILLGCIMLMELLFWSCCDPPMHWYEVTSLNLQVSAIDSVDNHFVDLVPLTSDSAIRSDVFAIRLTPVLQQLSESLPGYGNYAYACEDPPPAVNAVFEDIHITSDIDYNSDHPAGSDLGDIFHIGYAYYQYSGAFRLQTPLDEVDGLKVPFDYFLFTREIPDDTGVKRKFFIEVRQRTRAFQSELFVTETPTVQLIR